MCFRNAMTLDMAIVVLPELYELLQSDRKLWVKNKRGKNFCFYINFNFCPFSATARAPVTRCAWSWPTSCRWSRRTRARGRRTRWAWTLWARSGGASVMSAASGCWWSGAYPITGMCRMRWASCRTWSWIFSGGNNHNWEEKKKKRRSCPSFN